MDHPTSEFLKSTHGNPLNCVSNSSFWPVDIAVRSYVVLTDAAEVGIFPLLGDTGYAQKLSFL